MQDAMHSSGPHAGHYARLVAMVVVSFIAMYVLMYAMVDTAENVYPNINQAYMAGLMAAPMASIEMALMRRMYPNRLLNFALLGGSIALMALCWFGIRSQLAVSDQQFLRSMIPHHASAILMCRQAAPQNADLHRLCEEIIHSQQREIDFMKARLK